MTQLKKAFFAFILPSFECCMLVWLTAANSHLELLDRALSNLMFILPDLSSNLDKHSKVGCQTLLFRILNNPQHPLYSKLPGSYLQRRITRYVLSLIDRAFSAITFEFKQFHVVFYRLLARFWSKHPGANIF